MICVDITRYPFRKYKHFGAIYQDEDPELFSQFILALLYFSEELLKYITIASFV